MVMNILRLAANPSIPGNSVAAVSMIQLAMRQRTDLNLIVTPRQAWSTREACQRLVDDVEERIQAIRDGELRNVVA
jgi:lactate dehydrogenase-like 2-hydroxyacid dehydrogenase